MGASLLVGIIINTKGINVMDLAMSLYPVLWIPLFLAFVTRSSPSRITKTLGRKT